MAVIFTSSLFRVDVVRSVEPKVIDILAQNLVEMFGMQDATFNCENELF